MNFPTYVWFLLGALFALFLWPQLSIMLGGIVGRVTNAGN